MIHLPQANYPAIPGVDVHFDVAVDVTRCGGPERYSQQLSALEKGGLRTNIPKLLAYASKHLNGVTPDYWNIGPHRARVQTTWQRLAPWNMRSEVSRVDSRPRLVLDDLKHSREKAGVSEILAAGIGLLVAKDVYGIPYRYWHPTEGLAPTDFAAPSSHGRAQLEVRGRFDRKNWASAIEQIATKFGSSPSISDRLGVVFAPRTTPNTRTADIAIVDPDAPELPFDDRKHLRALLAHYAEFFAVQNFVPFARRMRAISTTSDTLFDLYLDSGDRLLNALPRPYRTSFVFQEHVFRGTAWRQMPLPIFARSATTVQGWVIWGVLDSIIDALLRGHLRQISQANLWDGTAQIRRTQYVILDDGTAVAWAPTLKDLLQLD